MDKVSIIVSIYNVQGFVRRCLDSLISQTYINIEIIAVDDGSTDDCPQIIDEYAKLDSRIVAVHKKNGGLSSARNEGLDRYSGEYVIFVDGDDWIDRNAVEILLSEVRLSRAEVIMFPYKREYNDKSVETVLFDLSDKTFAAEEISNFLLPFLIGPGNNQTRFNPLSMDRLNTAWGKLYSKHAIEGFKFIDTQKIGVEDGLYNIEVMVRLVKEGGVVRYTEQTWYHYEKCNTTSLLHSYRTDYFNKRWNFYDRVRNILIESERIDLIQNLKNRIVLELFGETVNLLCAGTIIDNKSKYLKQILREKPYNEAFENFEFKKLNALWKAYYKLFKFNMINTALFITKAMMKLRG